MRYRTIFMSLVVLGALAATGLTGSSAWADKLVLFKNGKALRVKSAVADGKWLKCDFENGNYMSVPAAEVRKIEDAALGGKEGTFRANQVAEGVGTPYTPPPPGTRFDPAAQTLGENQPPGSGPAATQEGQEALAQETAEREAQGAFIPRRGGLGNRFQVNGTGRLTAGTNAVGGVQNGGLQPLNQVRTPFAGRRGLTQRNQGLPTVDSKSQDN